ncbi:MAG: 4Fe-4S binding protein [Deltaproteobacteria bacterium]|nr:4Fe-4S binding protein [Deltaproteobacteria bacterium]
MRRGRQTPPARRWVQGGLLLGFLLLFARTAYRGRDVLDWPVHLVFRLDPLAALAQWLAGGASILTAAWLGAGLLLLLTAGLGRFFCGWACPLGTTLDLLGGGLRRLLGSKKRQASLPAWTAPAVLAALTSATLLGLPLLGLLDPLSVLLRTLTLSLHPLFDAAAKGVFAGLDRSHLPIVAPAGEALYEFVKPRLLAFGKPAFLLSGLTGLAFAGVVALELRATRFWCAHLCPLGALLGLVSRFSPLRRRRSLACGACSACEAACPTGAALDDPADASLCVQCGACAQSAAPRPPAGPGGGARRPLPSRPGRSDGRC